MKFRKHHTHEPGEPESIDMNNVHRLRSHFAGEQSFGSALVRLGDHGNFYKSANSGRVFHTYSNGEQLTEFEDYVVEVNKMPLPEGITSMTFMETLQNHTNITDKGLETGTKTLSSVRLIVVPDCDQSIQLDFDLLERVEDSGICVRVWSEQAPMKKLYPLFQYEITDSGFKIINCAFGTEEQSLSAQIQSLPLEEIIHSVTSMDFADLTKRQRPGGGVQSFRTKAQLGK